METTAAKKSLFICNWQKIDFNWFPFHGYWTTNKWPSDVSRKLWQIKHSLEITLLACCRFSLSLSLLFYFQYLSWLLFCSRKKQFDSNALHTPMERDTHTHINLHRNQSNINFSRSTVWFILCECAYQFSFFIFTWQPFLPCHYRNSCDFALPHFKLTEERLIVEFLFPFCIMQLDSFLLFFFLLIFVLTSLALSFSISRPRWLSVSLFLSLSILAVLALFMLMLLRNTIQFSSELKSSMPIIP